jgi:hypothetical protein
MATDVIGELSFGESFKMLETGEVRAALSNDVTPLKIFYRKANISAICRA